MLKGNYHRQLIWSVTLLAGMLLAVAVSSANAASIWAVLPSGAEDMPLSPSARGLAEASPMSLASDALLPPASRAVDPEVLVRSGHLFHSIAQAFSYIRRSLHTGFRGKGEDLSNGFGVSPTGPVPVPALPLASTLFLTGVVALVGVACRPCGVQGSVVVPRVPIEQVVGGRSLRVLILSEEPLWRQWLADLSRRYGCGVECGGSVQEAERVAASFIPQVILVDRRVKGWVNIRDREWARTVPMMTVAPTESGWTSDVCVEDLIAGADQVHGCEEGPRLLIAKMRALGRRAATPPASAGIIRAGAVELDEGRHEVRVAGRPCMVQPVRFRLLKLLLSEPGQVFRRRELIDRIWGEGFAIEPGTVDVHLFWVRRMLAKDPAGCQRLVTIRGVGVKLVLVSAVSSERSDSLRSSQVVRPRWHRSGRQPSRRPVASSHARLVARV